MRLDQAVRHRAIDSSGTHDVLFCLGGVILRVFQEPSVVAKGGDVVRSYL
jgi:hypothetical protein